MGFAGVVLVALPQALAPAAAGMGATDNALGQLACLLATASYGSGFVWLRRYVLPRRIPPAVIAFGQVVCGLGWSLLAAPFLARGPVEPDLPVVLSMLALGILGTGLAFVLNTAVTVGLGATFASTVTYLSPLVGVVLGVAVLGEVITANEVVGGAVVVLGVAVGQGVLRLPRRRGHDPGAGRGGPVGGRSPTTVEP